ncbi:hypothetical protein AC1031_010134 [Aphanomyces cochlioides]|nr:hypothetical protein AC1031_010134 [Aphanomyces cochlioides]
MFNPHFSLSQIKTFIPAFEQLTKERLFPMLEKAGQSGDVIDMKDDKSFRFLLASSGAWRLPPSRSRSLFGAIRGPKATSFFFGNASESIGSVPKWHTTVPYPEPYLSWIKEYGGAIYYILSSLIQRLLCRVAAEDDRIPMSDGSTIFIPKVYQPQSLRNWNIYG